MNEEEKELERLKLKLMHAVERQSLMDRHSLLVYRLKRFRVLHRVDSRIHFRLSVGEEMIEGRSRRESKG